MHRFASLRFTSLRYTSLRLFPLLRFALPRCFAFAASLAGFAPPLRFVNGLRHFTDSLCLTASPRLFAFPFGILCKSRVENLAFFGHATMGRFHKSTSSHAALPKSTWSSRLRASLGGSGDPWGDLWGSQGIPVRPLVLGDPQGVLFVGGSEFCFQPQHFQKSKALIR